METSVSSFLKMAARPPSMVLGAAVRRRYSLLLISLLIISVVAFLHQTPLPSVQQNVGRFPNCVGCSAWEAAGYVENLPGRDVYKQLAHVFSEQNVLAPCRRLAFVGGKCSCDGRAIDGACGHLAAMDGKKPVCLDGGLLPETDGCLVYSFGVRNDPSFEGEMARLGCEVRAFDPTVAQLVPPALPPGVRHHRIGIDGRVWMYRGADGAELPLMTLGALREALGHQERRIDYVKLDAEGSEWLTLAEQLDTPDSALMTAVTQIHIEFHLVFPHGRLSDDPEWRHQLPEQEARGCLRAVVALQLAGFRMAHLRQMGAFPGIGLAHMYEALWIRQN